jgi:hypothetical protein
VPGEKAKTVQSWGDHTVLLRHTLGMRTKRRSVGIADENAPTPLVVFRKAVPKSRHLHLGCSSG